MENLQKIKKELQHELHMMGLNNREFSMSYTQMQKRQATIKLNSNHFQSFEKAYFSTQYTELKIELMLGSKGHTFTKKTEVKKCHLGYYAIISYRIYF